MILSGQDHTLEMGGVKSAPSEFKILNSAAAFGILSSGLYSDKITAVAREIVCNAWDSHQSAGKPEHPIEIHLPTNLEPYFSVKDEGTGLPHEDMVELYTTYFATTKGKSNDDIGGFGLGCKSPFAYTSGFTVVSTQDGVSRTYAAMLSESGVPVITLMDEDPTDAPNGIEVSMPVKSNDMWEFRTKTQKVLEFFPHHKTNLSEFKPFQTEYTHKGEGWAIRHRNNEHIGHGKPRAMVGKVAYLFPTDMTGLTDEQKAILGLPIDLYFGIGELDVTPSRESLSMTKRSIANIKKRLQDIFEHIIESLRQEIASAPSLWYAKLALKERLQNGSPFRPLVQKVISKYFGQYNNFVLSEISTLVELKVYQTMTLLHREINHRTDKPSKTLDLKTELNYKGMAAVQTSEDVVFYMNDTFEFVPRLTKRILELHQGQGRKITLYLINAAKGADPSNVSKEFAKIVNELGEPEVLFASDLPPVPKKPRGQRVPTDTSKYAWIMGHSRHHAARDNWEKATHEALAQDGIMLYIQVDRLEPVGITQSIVHEVFGAAKTLGLTIETEDDSLTLDKNTQMFGLNTEGVKRIANLPNWVNFFTYLKENAPEVPKDYIDYLAAKRFSVSFEDTFPIFNKYNEYNYRTNYKAFRQLLRGTFFHKQSVLVRRVLQLLKRSQNETPAYKAWENMVNFTRQDLNLKKGAIPGEITLLIKQIKLKDLKAKYPMLRIMEVSSWWLQDNANYPVIADYIKSLE